MHIMLKNILTHTLERTGGLALARYLTRSKTRILMYHRVIENPALPGISPELFEQQLIYIKRHFNVVSLNQLLKDLGNRQKNYQVAITFDDGHHDFYRNAWPILKKHNAPATLFATTGFIDRRVWLWPDMLRMIMFTAKPNTYLTEEMGKITLSSDNALSVWNTVADYCLTLSHAARMSYINNLADLMDVPIHSEPQEPFAPVTWDELRKMSAEGLDIGSHSDTHPILSDLNDDDLITELKISKQRILDEIGISPKGICYPNGMAKDVSEKVEHYAKQFYEYGVVAYPAPINIHKMMHLGRYAASSNLSRFKLLINGASLHINDAGEYQ